MESVSCMLHARRLPKQLSAEACTISVYTLNRTVPKPVQGKIPLELRTGL